MATGILTRIIPFISVTCIHMHGVFPRNGASLKSHITKTAGNLKSNFLWFVWYSGYVLKMHHFIHYPEIFLSRIFSTSKRNIVSVTSFWHSMVHLTFIVVLFDFFYFWYQNSPSSVFLSHSNRDGPCYNHHPDLTCLYRDNSASFSPNLIFYPKFLPILLFRSPRSPTTGPPRPRMYPQRRLPPRQVVRQRTVREPLRARPVCT